MNQLTHEDLRSLEQTLTKHQLPSLDYDYAALEPCIDVRTMTLHHDIHHGGYVDKLNAALKNFPELGKFSALWLLCNLNKVPEEIRTAVHSNAGGHVNHSMFWRAMSPVVKAKTPTPNEPKGLLLEALIRDFGSVADFKARFEGEGGKVFGSGWVWLVRTKQDGDKLAVITTAGHDNPMMQGDLPLLLNDVWEHAYYLKYESRRADYLKAWWSIVDWEEAARRFAFSDMSEDDLWEA